MFKSIKTMSKSQAIENIRKAQALLPLAIQNLQRPVPKGYEGGIIEQARLVVQVSDFLEEARGHYGDLDSLLESEKK